MWEALGEGKMEGEVIKVLCTKSRRTNRRYYVFLKNKASKQTNRHGCSEHLCCSKDGDLGKRPGCSLLVNQMGGPSATGSHTCIAGVLSQLSTGSSPRAVSSCLGSCVTSSLAPKFQQPLSPEIGRGSCPFLQDALRSYNTVVSI